MEPLIVSRSSHNNRRLIMLDAKLVAAINWEELIRVGLQLFAELRKEDIDWATVIKLGLQIFQLLTAAEEISATRINWAELIKLIISLLPIFLGDKE